MDIGLFRFSLFLTWFGLVGLDQDSSRADSKLALAMDVSLT